MKAFACILEVVEQVTISLMVAARKMTKRQVLVRKIDAVETLGCVAVLSAYAMFKDTIE